MLELHYPMIQFLIKVTISKKSSRRDEVSAHAITFLKIVSHAGVNGVGVGGSRRLVAFGHSGLLP